MPYSNLQDDGALGASVDSAEIEDGTIVNADIKSDAAIELSKLDLVYKSNGASAAGALAVDWDVSTVVLVTGTEIITSVAFSGGTVGVVYTLILKQAAAANYAISGWAADIEIAGGSFTWTATNAAVDVLLFMFDGTNYWEISRSQDDKTPA